MALTHWKSSEDLYADRDLLPYWRRNWFWDDDYNYGSLSRFWDAENRNWGIERKWESERVELIPTTGINGFKVSMDIRDYNPSDLTVKTDEHSVEVEGKHEEYRYGRRYVSRSFNRRYTLPPGYNGNAITSELSSDGILTIKAPAPNTFDHFIRSKKLPGYKLIKKVHF